MKPNRTVLIAAVISLLAIGIAVYGFVPRSLNSNDPLQVSPQEPSSRVVVDEVRMLKPGWVVARGIEGERLGQIIEISRYLPSGTHEDVEISLGEFYQGGELVVMIYDDEGDGVFNDLDRPAIDGSGRMTGRYVRTGKPLPASMAGAITGSGMAHDMSGVAAMIQVRYTDEGFVPSSVEVPVGSMVEFINDSGTQMWVASDTHPGHEQLPTFDQFTPYESGGVYRYTFDKVGTWAYHDHLSPENEGVIMVQ